MINMSNEMKPLKFWVQTILPLVYDDSLSYYEVLAKCIHYINTLINGYNELNNRINNLNVDELEVELQEIRNLIDTIPIEQLQSMASDIETLQIQMTEAQNNINNKANIESPTFTGVPKAPTANTGTNNTQIATTAFVQQENKFPSGGGTGQVLVKTGSADYVAEWTSTPPQMGSLATIETSPATQAHTANSFLVFNGQLYKVISNISQGQSLTIGANISLVSGGAMDYLTVSSQIPVQSGPEFTTQDIKIYRYGSLVSVSGYILIQAGTYGESDLLFSSALRPRDFVYADGFSSIRYSFPILLHQDGGARVQDTITVPNDVFVFVNFFYFTID